MSSTPIFWSLLQDCFMFNFIHFPMNIDYLPCGCWMKASPEICIYKICGVYTNLYIYGDIFKEKSCQPIVLSEFWICAAPVEYHLPSYCTCYSACLFRYMARLAVVLFPFLDNELNSVLSDGWSPPWPVCSIPSHHEATCSLIFSKKPLRIHRTSTFIQRLKYTFFTNFWKYLIALNFA